MSKFWTVVVILTIAGTAFLTYKLAVPRGYVVISEAELDSLLKPDTLIIRDTIRPLPDKVKVEKSVPVPVYKDTLIAYHDSLVNDKVSIHIHDTVSNRGIIKSRLWTVSYFIPQYIVEERTVYRPYAFKEKSPTSKKYGYYAGVGLGKSLSLEGGITRGRFMVGVSLDQDMNANLKLTYIIR